MEINNALYPIYLNTPAGEIPREELAEILIELMSNAMFYMNSSLEETQVKTTREAIIYFLKHDFAYMPLSTISEAFMNGSLGKLGGTTKFTVRNVHVWLEAMKEQFQRQQSQKRSQHDQQEKMREEKDWKENHRGVAIFGTALDLKLSWVYAGAIRAENWDDYSLDAIVNHLRAGETVETLKPSMIRL
jgi:soluble cytochrome b562